MAGFDLIFRGWFWVIANSSAVNLDIAHFFLSTFLGCTYATKPETSTRGFFEATEEWFNRAVPNPEKKTRYEQALLAEMNSAHQLIRPSQFAADYIEVGDRQSLIEHLGALGVPTNQFRKDNKLIQSKLKRIEYKFASGVSVLLRPDSIESGIAAVSDAGDGRTKVEVVDELRKMGGRS